MLRFSGNHFTALGRSNGDISALSWQKSTVTAGYVYDRLSKMFAVCNLYPVCILIFCLSKNRANCSN